MLSVIPFDYKNYAGKVKDNLKNDIVDVTFLEENLSVCVPHNSELAKYDTLTFSDINGYNCLLKDKIGFWTKLCFEKMPASKFLIQTNDFDFQELVKTSTLLCFVTNFATNSENIMSKRKIIPITDREANVTYHLISAKKMFLENI